jgi:hypothetical protein
MPNVSSWNFTAVPVPPTEAEWKQADTEAALLASLGIPSDDDYDDDWS